MKREEWCEEQQVGHAGDLTRGRPQLVQCRPRSWKGRGRVSSNAVQGAGTEKRTSAHESPRPPTLIPTSALRCCVRRASQCSDRSLRGPSTASVSAPFEGEKRARVEGDASERCLPRHE